VVHVAELVAVILMLHGSLSFLADVYNFFYPSGLPVWFLFNHWSTGPVGNMVFSRPY